ncbi:MAG: histidine--tRNA ligase [Candidatus Bathyarchaeota archaeon]|nr:histidine--tRNA ligase [Candidatus Bathyarchaeota archaeon]
MKMNPPRGMKDFLPEDLAKRRYVEDCIRRLFKLYGYDEVETPTLESYELLAAKVGEETRRSMYIVEDLKGRRYALRPEGTSPIARLVISRFKTYPKPIRLGYIWDFYRYDEPQFGRYRRFYQGGFELIGASSVEADVEILSIAVHLFRMLGIPNFYLKMNHVGIIRSILSYHGYDEDIQNRILSLADKKRYDELIDFLVDLKAADTLINTISEIIRLKSFDIRSVVDRARILLKDYSEALGSLERLESLVNLMSKVNGDVRILIDLGFGRGLEYYTGVIFEVFVEGIDIALAGGGRYDKLIEYYGGDPTPAVGFSPGIDRIVSVMEKLGILPSIGHEKLLLVVPASDRYNWEALKVSYQIRSKGIPVVTEVSMRRLKDSLSYADRMGFRYTAIIGEEYRDGLIVLKDMKARSQVSITLDKLIEMLEGKATI